MALRMWVAGSGVRLVGWVGMHMCVAGSGVRLAGD